MKTFFQRINECSRIAAGAGVATLMSTAAFADFVINDDLIVDGSACIGFDCVNGESFGFDTIRLKENNLRIKADDTSTAASFPRNDWQLTFNDSANGGASKFSVDDISGSRTPFTIEANAPSHSLYVDDGGRIGSGTSIPSVEMHIVDGDTPTLRLAQDGSSGFAPQTWDVAGNETSFFIRDVTNGSTLPFRIRPDSTSNTLVIDDDNVGVGTLSPSESLHVRGTDGTTQLFIEEASGTSASRTLLRLSNSGLTTFQIDNTTSGVLWNFQSQNSGDFAITNPVGTGAEFELSQNGELTISGQIVTGGGTCGGGCDAVFSEDYELSSIEDHATEMFALGYLPNVGPTVENAPINVSDKLGRMLNELEHAHIYIATLNAEMAAMKSELDTLRDRLAASE